MMVRPGLMLMLVAACASTPANGGQRNFAPAYTTEPESDGSLPFVSRGDSEWERQFLDRALLPQLSDYAGPALRYLKLDARQESALIIQLVQVDPFKTAQLMVLRMNEKEDVGWKIEDREVMAVPLEEFDQLTREMIRITVPRPAELSDEWKRGTLLVCPHHGTEKIEISVNRGGFFEFSRERDCREERTVEQAGRKIREYAAAKRPEMDALID